MAITFPITLPTTPGFTTSKFRLTAHTTVHPSILDRTETVLERGGAMWSGAFSLPPMLRPAASVWLAKLVSLRGRYGTFYGFDPDAKTPQGTVSVATVNGASQTGRTLNVTMTGTLLAGDFFHFTSTGRYHMVVEDQSGSGTLEIEPALRESPANAEVLVWTNPRVKMRLITDITEWDADLMAVFGISFAGIEDLN